MVKFVLNFLVDKLYSVDCEIEWIRVGEQDWDQFSNGASYNSQAPGIKYAQRLWRLFLSTRGPEF